MTSTAPSKPEHSRPGPDTHPHLCWSTHYDNFGKPRPKAVWTVSYGCAKGHEVTANQCDRCAAFLVDGKAHCGICVYPMVVTALAEYAPEIAPSKPEPSRV